MRPTTPAICLLATTLALTSPAVAGGIDFANMPVGCSWTVEFSDGSRWSETFLGKLNGVYTTEYRLGSPSGELQAHKYFDDQGRMTKRVLTTGVWETYTPHSCFGIIGLCRLDYADANGNGWKMYQETQKTGQVYSTIFSIGNQPPSPVETYTLGPYGVVVKSRSATLNTDLVEFANCNLADI